MASTRGSPNMIRAITRPARTNARMNGTAARKEVIERVTGKPSEV